MENNRKITGAYIVLILVSFMVYSSSGIFLKLTSLQIFPSLPCVLYFTLAICTLGIYAVLWQVILKKVLLTQAFLFKGVTILYSLSYAVIIFGEEITVKNVIGALFIIGGIVINSQSKAAI